MASKIRVAVVGAGNISKTHLKAYASMPDHVEVTALVETDPARRKDAERRHFLPVSGDYHAVLSRDDVDLVDICTPPVTHEGLVTAGLEAGKSLVCEKPLATTLDALDRIEAVARRHPGRLATMHQYRLMPEIVEMLRLRDAGDLGDLLFGQFAQTDQLAGGPVELNPWWGEWSTAGGGVGMTQFVHLLDVMCVLFGRPVEVRSMIATLGAPIESEDTLSASVRFEGGALVGATATMVAQRTGFRIDVLGSKGSVHYPWAVHLTRDGKPAGRVDELRASGLRAYQKGQRVLGRGINKARRTVGLGGAVETKHAVFLRDLVERMRAGMPLPVPPQEARRPVELCTAIYESGVAGAPVTLPLASSSPFYCGVSVAQYPGRHRDRRVVQPVGRGGAR